MKNEKCKIFIKLALILFFVSSSLSFSKTTQDYFHEAINFYLHNNTEKAKENLEKVLEIDPSHKEAKKLLEKITDGKEENKKTPAKITLNFHNIELSLVLRVLADETGVQFVLGQGLENKKITAFLSEISLEEGLSLITNANGLYCKKLPENNIYIVTTAENIKASRELAILKEPVITKIFQLKYISASDIKPIIEKKLSKDGKMEILSKSIYGGWELGGVSTSEKEMGTKIRKEKKSEEKPRFFVVTDVSSIIENITQIISQLDIKPQQIYIDATIVEVNSNIVQNLGIKWSGEIKATGATREEPYPFKEPPGGTPVFTYGSISFSELSAQLQVLETKGTANILSNPRIMVLDNHEAVIIAGERYPIMTTTREESSTGGSYFTGELDHYEPIGVSLRVIPHVIEKCINMIIHPEVTSLGDDVTGGSGEGALTLPRINTREADTNVTVKSGETIVIGGLLQKSKEDNVYKIPFLGDIPLLGYLFKRTEKNPSKLDLLIFITPRILNEEESIKISEEERTRTQSKQ